MKYLQILIVLLSLSTQAQIDTAIAVPLLGVNFGGQLPGGDLSSRFGPNLRAGGSFLYKTKKNWVLGADAFYLFGKNVRQDVLSQLRTKEGSVIDNEGFPADLRITERGFGVHAVIGKVIPVFNDGPNSGVFITVGLGYMQHKINLYDAQQKIAALKGSLKKGYDHLTGGLSSSQFIGYLHLSENRILNYYAGFEFYQIYSQSIRKLNYDTGSADLNRRLDLLSGFRFGWILPLYERKPNDSYFY
jgi:hypothetical protein